MHIHAGLVLALLFVPHPGADDTPVDGAPGAGDPYFPSYGNGGYDALHYALALRVDVEKNHLEGVATIDATATVPLRSFHLDLKALEVSAVAVDGNPAAFARTADELVVTPKVPLARGARFRTVVTYAGTPVVEPVPGLPVDGVGWMHFGDRIFTLAEPGGAKTWYPVNDHPRDKATYEFTVDVAAPYVVAANGKLASKEERDGRRTFVFRATHPMSSYLTTINIAPFEVEELEGPDGLPLTFYFPPGISEEIRAGFRRTPELLEACSEWFGPYPFETYGGVVMGCGPEAALETQTLPVYGGTRPGISIQVHELAHQWFGNSVGFDNWQELWLAEAFASYASWLWSERESGAEALATHVAAMHGYVCQAGDQLPADPGVERLFGIAVYVRGPLALHALRLELGDETFFELLRTWTKRYADTSRTTADFIALSEEVGERDLDGFFDAWLWTPEAPGIPELGLLCAENDAHSHGDE